MDAQSKTAELKRWEAETRQPGKFEGEARYVPYFWDLGLDGLSGEPEDDIWSFPVTDEDRQLFPELKGRATVKLRERDDGLVVGVIDQGGRK